MSSGEFVHDAHRALSAGELTEAEEAARSSSARRASDAAASSLPQQQQPGASARPQASSKPPHRISMAESGSLLDLEISEEPKSTTATALSTSAAAANPDSPTRAAAGGSVGSIMRGMGASLTSSLKKGLRSRSPSTGPSQVLDSSIPFAADSAAGSTIGDGGAGSSGSTDFFNSISEPRTSRRTSAAGGTPSPLATNPRTSLDQTPRLSSPTAGIRRPSAFGATALAGSHEATSPTFSIQSFQQGPPQAVPAAAPIASFAAFDAAFLPVEAVPVVGGQELLVEPATLDPRFGNLPTRRWTESSVFVDIQAHDLVSDAVHRAFPLSDGVRPMRRLLRQDEAEKRYGRDGALGALMFANSWQAVADVARQRLQRLSATPQRVDDIMKLWLVRLVALERLRLVDVIRTELQRLGDFDATDLRFEAHPEAFPGRSGSMVAFELRVFVARLPALTGHIHEAITGLYGLIYQARKLAATTGTDESKQDETALWPSRVAQLQLGVVNLLIELKDFRLAAAVLKGIAAGRMDDANVLSALGRVHLQVGNVPDARWCFDRVEALLLGNKAAAAAAATTTGGEVPDAAGGAAAASSWTVEDISRCARPDLVLANRAFVCMAADGDWESACRHLTDLINLVPGHPVAVNNLAVCHLYTGNVGQALSFLESLSIEMPAVAGNCPALLFNLATLFDLADQSADRKRRMLGTIVAAGAGDDLDPSCLKM